jgi:hypothetical protein
MSALAPCTTARSIISDTACAASRPPIVANPRSRQPVRRLFGKYRTRRSGGTAWHAPERSRRVAAAAPPQRDLWLSARLDSGIAAINFSSSISAGTRAGPCFVKGPAPPRRPRPRKNRAVVQTSSHDARSHCCVKSAMNNATRKILWIVLRREGGASSVMAACLRGCGHHLIWRGGEWVTGP